MVFFMIEYLKYDSGEVHETNYYHYFINKLLLFPMNVRVAAMWLFACQWQAPSPLTMENRGKT